MKYYLLTFNEGWADEHSVPALACYPEDTYQRWYNNPKGKPNLDYEEQLAAFEAKKKPYEDRVKILKDNGLYSKSPLEWPVEFEYLKNQNPPYVGEWERPKKGKSFIYASLGNNGDNFSDSFSDCMTAQDFIDKGYVSVTEVNESFYNVFLKAGLSNLSLSNVLDVYMNEEDYEDDFNEEDDE